MCSSPPSLLPPHRAFLLKDGVWGGVTCSWVQGLKMLTLEPDLVGTIAPSGRSDQSINHHHQLAQNTPAGATAEEKLPAVSEEEERVAVKFKGKRTIVEKRETSNDIYSWGQGSISLVNIRADGFPF